jgi:hypothetical protein
VDTKHTFDFKNVAMKNFIWRTTALMCHMSNQNHIIGLKAFVTFSTSQFEWLSFSSHTTPPQYLNYMRGKWVLIIRESRPPTGNSEE